MKLAGAIFDMDGTLLASMDMWRSVGSSYIKSKGLIPAESLDKRLNNYSMIKGAEYLKKEYGIEGTSVEIISEINEMIKDFYSRSVTIKPYVTEFLDNLCKNNVKLCLATATDRYLVEKALMHTGLDKYFSDIITCTEAGVGKESPIIFEKALEIIHTDKSNTIVFEDAFYAVKTAKDAGFTVMTVYDRTNNDYLEKTKEISDYYSVDFKDWSVKSFEESFDDCRV